MALTTEQEGRIRNGSAFFILCDNYYELKGCINLQNEKNNITITRKKSIICFTYN